MAWYAIKRELRPITFGISRTVEFKESILLQESPSSDKSDEERMKERKQIHSTPRAYGENIVTWNIWGVNSDLKTRDIPLKIRCFEISTGSMVFESDKMTARLLPIQSTEISKMADITEDDPSNLVVSVEYQISPGETLRSSADWPQPLKYVDFSGRKFTCSVENEIIRVEVDKPVKGVILDVEGDDDSELEWSDNGFDVMPGEVVNITAKGLNGRKVTVSWYGENV
jgi:beta-mannosidase